jgi:chromosome condensin MukBEF complex kleisin-like MukF subunit
MNFLLHRHLGARDLGSAAAGVGAMLPDLWRMADRHVRPAASAVDEGPSDGVLADVLAGVQHHLVADRWFHRDRVFVDGEREATQRLRDARLGARRSVLLGHVLWELCLDGELVRREGAEQLKAALRSGVDSAGPRLSLAVETHHFARAGRSLDERRAFDDRLARIVDALLRGPWIDGYAAADGVAARIQGVRTRLGLEPMDADDLARFAAVADALRASAALALDAILVTASFTTARTRDG